VPGAEYVQRLYRERNKEADEAGRHPTNLICERFCRQKNLDKFPIMLAKFDGAFGAENTAALLIWGMSEQTYERHEGHIPDVESGEWTLLASGSWTIQAYSAVQAEEAAFESLLRYIDALSIPHYNLLRCHPTAWKRRRVTRSG